MEKGENQQQKRKVSVVLMKTHNKTVLDFSLEITSKLTSLSKDLFNAKWQQQQFVQLTKDIQTK